MTATTATEAAEAAPSSTVRARGLSPLTAFTLLVAAHDRATLAQQADGAEVIVLPAASPGGISPTDFNHAGQLIRNGLVVARGALSGSAPAMGARHRCALEAHRCPPQPTGSAS